MMRLLLLSNSTNAGEPYLSWPRPLIERLLGTSAGPVVFIPFAGVRTSWTEYSTAVRAALTGMGPTLESIHEAPDPIGLIRDARAIVVGGGNTFHLLAELQRRALLEPVRRRVTGGAAYLGWSAGANLACPTIRTTNDMPIVETAGLAGLGLVPFQINPHFTDAVLPNHGGESRRQRIDELLMVDPAAVVVGLREGTGLQVEAEHVTLVGRAAATLFRHGHPPVDHEPGASLDFLLRAARGALSSSP